MRCDTRLLHSVAFSKKLRWLAQTKVISLKTQPYAVNARRKNVSQRSLNINKTKNETKSIAFIRKGEI